MTVLNPLMALQGLGKELALFWLAICPLPGRPSVFPIVDVFIHVQPSSKELWMPAGTWGGRQA